MARALSRWKYRFGLFPDPMMSFTIAPALLVLMAPSSSNGAFQQVFMFGMIFVIFYFFMILPQQRLLRNMRRLVVPGGWKMSRPGVMALVGRIHGLQRLPK